MPCNPVPPYPLPAFPISNGDAEALGLNDDLGVPMTSGTCACDDPYEVPECDECETCDDVDGTFLVNVLGRNFSMTKSASAPCSGDCCFVGYDGDDFATLSWSAGVWSLQVNLYVAESEYDTAGYQGSEDVCDTLFDVAFQDGSPGQEWPEVITVSRS